MGNNNKTKLDSFKQELKELLEKYNATIDIYQRDGNSDLDPYVTVLTVDKECLFIEMDEDITLSPKYLESDRQTKEKRTCDICGNYMSEGYVLAGTHACSDECALEHFAGDKEKLDEAMSHADEDGSDYYFTEWESIYLEG